MSRKKLLAVMTAMALATTSTMPVNVNAATSLKIKNVASNKKTMYVGKTFTIKTNLSKSKLSFSSSKTSVATVSKKGVISAKKSGSCTIKVVGKISKNKKITKKISLTVKTKANPTTDLTSSTLIPESSSSVVATASAQPITTATVAPSASANAGTQAPVNNAQSGSNTNTTTQPTESTNSSFSGTAAPAGEGNFVPGNPDNILPGTTPNGTFRPGRPDGSTTASSGAVMPFPSNMKPNWNTSSPNGTTAVVTSAPATTAPAPTPVTTPIVAASGSVVVSSVTFTENGVTLADAEGNVVEPSDAANLVVTDNTYVTITSPTNDTQNPDNDQVISLSGTCSNGQVKVAVDKTTYPDGVVELSLQDLKLSNTITSPVFIQAIDDTCVISMKKGSTNVLTDGSYYSNEDDTTGVIYSKDDVKIKGKGSLEINGNYGYGIFSKNDLKVYNGTLTIHSQDVCLKGKDSVKIGNKDDLATEGAYDNLKVTLTSELGDCVRSNNPMDDATLAATDSDYADGKAGTIQINGGTISVNAKQGDGFQSAGTLTVNGGTIAISTYEGSSYSNNKNTNNPGNSWQMMPGGTTGGHFNKGTVDATSSATTVAATPAIAPAGTATVATAAPANTTTADISAKGLKSDGDMTICGGTITADTSDDALHCGATLTITAGTLSLATGDDGIHSDAKVQIDGGNINVTKAYEGIEGTDIIINNGTIHVKTSDDGINAAGGNSNSTWSQGTMPGQAGNYSLTINGGYVLVEPSGDGLDSNGSLTIAGGTTLVVGPVSGSENSFDCDGAFTFSGGVAIGIDQRNQLSSFPTSGSYTTRALTGSTSGTNSIAITNNEGKLLDYITYSVAATSLTYMNGNTDVDTCKVYLNPVFDGETDSFGHTTTGTLIENGTELTGASTSSGGMGGRF